jgi:hypothetical protein
VIRLRIGFDFGRFGEHLDEVLRQVAGQVESRRRILTRRRWRRFSRSYDHAAFVDPDAAWNVDDAEEVRENVVSIDQ